MTEWLRSIPDYSRPSLVNIESIIIRPAIKANKFEKKRQMWRKSGISDNAIRLRLFPFSLKEKVKKWLISLPRGSITTWEQMVKETFGKVFPSCEDSKDEEWNFFIL